MYDMWQLFYVEMEFSLILAANEEQNQVMCDE
jgi:hypothetical protein